MQRRETEARIPEPIGEPPPRSGEIVLSGGRARHWIERRVPELRELEIPELKRAVNEAKRGAKSGLASTVLAAMALSVLLLLVYAFVAVYILATYFPSGRSYTPTNVAYYIGVIGMPTIAVVACRGIYRRAIAVNIIGRMCGGRCVVCGYDVGSDGTRDHCPECGTRCVGLVHDEESGAAPGVNPQLRIDPATGELVRERREK